ncbi:hypothetical protein E2C01_099699 [Portunus trituberculatus]|uniref:Uncharacterized protein n=1 Tax=Portunus trituberculatus TaxID=210409 RepID=A0A5B7K4G9_PORTR|nr:hypothetical protein [Portunus trituberculatus]
MTCHSPFSILSEPPSIPALLPVRPVLLPRLSLS